MNHKTEHVRRQGGRTGFTTGACAAAAVRAAAAALVLGRVVSQVATLLPNGQVVDFVVAQASLDENGAMAVVIKDAGDDPDCTHGAQMTAHVRLAPDRPGEILLQGGAGVGMVTRPGLGLALGEAAINPVPRKNIIANVHEVAASLLVEQGLWITLSVPQGKEMAKKTLNGRLGIEGGISILGTSGIVYPYSTSAYKAAVQQAIQSAAAAGLDTVVLTTGRRTERFAMEHFPQWPPWAFIQMGDFVGSALEAASASGVGLVILAVMPGKLAKIAQGIKNTHAHKTALDMSQVARLAREAGASETLVDQVAQGITVRFAAEQLEHVGLKHRFYQALAQAAHQGLQPWLGGETRARVLALDFEGQLLAQVGEGV